MLEDLKKSFQQGKDAMSSGISTQPGAPPVAQPGFSFLGFGLNPYQSDPVQKKDLKVLAK